ncbi:MAG: flagellar biosynthetic protein FliQ [Pseudomonadota bacterium]
MIADPAVLYDLTRQAIWISVAVSAPLLVVALVAGITIGLVQALTSVQEMTLTFVPKVGAMLLAYWLSMSFMTESLVGFFRDQIIPAIAGG